MQKIKVKSMIISEPITVQCLGDRLYSIANDQLKITVVTNEGSFVYKFKNGFVTNFRSGGVMVDCFIDQIGTTQEMQALWLIHDAAYTPCAACDGEHPISKELADELLYACLRFVKVPAWKAGTVYYSVKWFGKSAYYDDDELTEKNKNLFSFDWLTFDK